MVEVEADLGNGIPGFVILGLPDAALREARERIKPRPATPASHWRTGN